ARSPDKPDHGIHYHQFRLPRRHRAPQSHPVGYRRLDPALLCLGRHHVRAVMIYVLDGTTSDSADQQLLRQLSNARKADIGLVPLRLTERPEPEPGMNLAYSASLVDGEWVQVWEQVPMTETELKSVAVKLADTLVRAAVVDE